MLRKSNIVWTAIFTVLALVSFLIIYLHSYTSSGKKTAVIYQGDTEIQRISLDEVTEPYEFDVSCENGTNRIRVENGRICMLSADCPDKVCVNQGYITDSSLPIVCLPHKLSIVIEESDGAEFDAVAGQ